MKKIELYNYFRSSASYRVRIALNLKGLSFVYRPVHLIKDGGEQNQKPYREVNPAGEVPTLIDDGFVISQSMAIIFYLDDKYPEPRLIPVEPKAKAKVIQLCEAVNAGMQPLQNLKVLQELESRFGVDQGGKDAWVQRWVTAGFESMEKALEKTSGTYCFSDHITAADCFLIPQVFTAKRFNVDMSNYPNISRINETCLNLDAFKKAHPMNQPDTPQT